MTELLYSTYSNPYNCLLLDIRIYLVWKDDTPGNNDIFFSVSKDNCQTFTFTDNISNNTGDSSRS